jgi:hypothetical protein
LIFVICSLLAIGLFLLVLKRPHTFEDKVKRPANQSRVAAEPEIPLLEITAVVQHGHIYEIKGRVERGALVMINDEKVPTFGESSFRYFVGPLPTGLTVITVTLQNEKGGVNTKQLAITAP